jgi:hypothetical protein
LRGLSEPEFQTEALVKRFHETDHMRTDFQFVIPGRRSAAEANPESSNH